MKKLIYLALFVSTLFYSCEKGELESIAPDVTIEAKTNENILANETSKILLTIKSTQKDATYTVKFNTDKEAVLNGQANNGEIILRNGEHILTYDPNDIAYGEHNVTLTITNDFGKTIEKKFKINVSDTAFITVDKEEQEVYQSESATYNFTIKNNNSNLTYSAIFPDTFPENLTISDQRGIIKIKDIIDISPNNPLTITLSSLLNKNFELPIVFKSSNGFEYTKIIKYNTLLSLPNILQANSNKKEYSKLSSIYFTGFVTSPTIKNAILNFTVRFYNLYDGFIAAYDASDLVDKRIFTDTNKMYFQTKIFPFHRMKELPYYATIEIIDKMDSSNTNSVFSEQLKFKVNP